MGRKQQGAYLSDEQIVDLYFAREERAIAETDKKYCRYLHTVAYNILANEQDAEECENDTYLKAWESMPPHRPARLSSFIGRITRNVALNRYTHDRAQKRSPGTEVVYGELAELVSDSEADDAAETAELGRVIDRFLASLPRETRIVFVQRYWYLCPIKDIAKNRGLTESNVKVILMRTRNKLKKHLEKEGINL